MMNSSNSGLISKDTLTLAGRWRLRVDELTHHCNQPHPNTSHILTIHSQALVFDTQDGDILWIEEHTDGTHIQTIGQWVVGEPLILDLKMTRHGSSEDSINLFHLIASQITEDTIEGEAWLHDVAPDFLEASTEVDHQSERVAPKYRGRFYLRRLE